jgi:hypothetical protein
MNDTRAPSETSLELDRLAKLPWFESGKPAMLNCMTCQLLRDRGSSLQELS